MAGRSDPALADLRRIALEKSQGSRQTQATVSMLARITRACQGSLRNYPETAGVVLEYASDLASAARSEELVGLLHIVQAALRASSGPDKARIAIEHRLWRRTLDTALNGTLKPTREGIVLSEVFTEELAAVVEEYQDALARELKATQARVHEITKQLDAARQSLAEVEKRRQEALRSYAQSQASGSAVSDDRRLLAEVAQILAETDRVATTQQLRPEAVAQLLQARLGRLLKRARVKQVGHIGERIPFDPRRHEIIEGTLGPRQIVEVIEVGHEQLLENGEASGVKTALVRATGE
jgi:molecular chaperone GrpE (heat shock protein)